MTLWFERLRLRHLLLELASGIWAVAVAIAPAFAQHVAPEQAPAEWVRYAEATTASVTNWLQGDGEAAVRVRAYLDATRPAPDQPTEPLLLKIWVNPEGAISRVEHAPFAHAQANADLEAVVVGQRLAGRPPRKMLFPLRILVQLPPAPAGDQTASPAPNAAASRRSTAL